MSGVRAAFLGGAAVIAEALADDAVVQAWDAPSILEEQTVGGIAGHLARGGVWAVADYLDGPPPTGPVDLPSAGAYFAELLPALDEEDHAAIRARGAAIAAEGPAQVLATLVARLPELRALLDGAAPDAKISVIAGKVLHLDDYLCTRIVEQAVHLDDLARSIGRPRWDLPEACERIAIEVGVDVARRRDGNAALLRALYRDGQSVLPVLR